LDSVTLEDWGEEIFAKGVGLSGENGQGGEGEKKKKYACP